MIKFKVFGFGGSEKKDAAVPLHVAPQEVSLLQEGSPINRGGKRVLIVDDDLVFLRATALKLQAAGFQVRIAKEGPEANAVLGESPADVILLDINFPADVCNGGMGSWDGFQIMTWIRGLPAAKGARFMMVSNSDAVWDRQRAQQMGAVAYFTKPLDHEKVVAALNAVN
jgi:CheY-like chemotaxis protein